MDVIFDGECGLCTRAVGWLRRMDRRGRLRYHPFQRAGVLERFGLSDADARASVWAVCGEQRRSGAAAVNAAADAALGIGLCVALYRLPLIGRVQERVYRWVAEHRYRFRGVRPWCDEHPDDCGPVRQLPPR